MRDVQDAPGAHPCGVKCRQTGLVPSTFVRRNSAITLMSDSGPRIFENTDWSEVPPGTARNKVSAGADRGTRCSRPDFIRPAGNVYCAVDRSISD